MDKTEKEEIKHQIEKLTHEEEEKAKRKQAFKAKIRRVGQMSLMLKKVKEDAETNLKYAHVASDGKIHKETYLSSMPLTMFR